nr:DUF6531 domain-containing protein [Myxococcota bacterium]
MPNDELSDTPALTSWAERLTQPATEHPPLSQAILVARAEAVLGAATAVATPFSTAPPPEQGMPGAVVQYTAGVLGVINAPAMFIDAAAAQGVQTVLDATGLGALFPPMPVAVLGSTMHVGTPHVHTHPPSLVPPAPPIPLPSMGVAFLAGSASVLVNGVPALRAGDIGLGLTCGSMAPPFEIMTGASGVFFGGSRVARLGDITFHCNPIPLSPPAIIGTAMGIAGIAVTAAGAAVQASTGNTGAAIAQAAQAALDASAMALSSLRGMDPAGPPGVGALIGPPTTVLAGGPPIPNLGSMAMGAIFGRLDRALRQAAARVRRPTACADVNGTTGRAGEPVDVVTGASFDTHRDFASVHGGFVWSRHVTSARAQQHGVLGWGFRHGFEHQLRLRLHRAIYESYDGERIELARVRHGETVVRSAGYVLRQLDERRFSLSHRRIGTLCFERVAPGSIATRLVSITRDGVQVDLRYDGSSRLVEIRERVIDSPAIRGAVYTLHYDRDHHLAEVRGGPESAVPRRLVAYGFDRAGHLVATEDAHGSRQQLAYDGAHRIVTSTDRNGYRYTYEYDAEGRCVFTTGQDGLWWSRLHYEEGKTRHELHDGTARTYHFAEDGVITEVVDPLGGVLTRIRDREGRVVAEVDAGGRRLELLYDDDDAHCARRDRFGFTYPPQIDQPKLPNPFVRDLPVTALERVLGDAIGVAGTTPASMPHVPEVLRATATSIFQPLASQPVARELDSHGRVLRETDALGRVRHWQYDRAGNEISFRDADGRVRTRRIVSWNQIGAECDPLGATTHYTRNPHEHVTSVTDPLGTLTVYQRDAKDRIVRVTRGGRVRDEYTYDLGDRLLEKRDAHGTVLMRIEPHANGLPGHYDLGDGGTIDLDYDRNGNVVRADSHAHRCAQRWDESSRRTRDLVDAREVRHRYRRGQLQATEIAGHATSFERDPQSLGVRGPAGRRWHIELRGNGVVDIDHGNGTREVQQYDLDGRLVARLAWRVGSSAEVTTSWAVRHDYSPAGDLLSVWDSARGHRRFETDAAHRLSAELLPSGERLEYTLDLAGNILSKPGLELVELAPGNRIASVAGHRFEYDHRDHVAARRAPDGTEIRYVHDAADQLVRIEDGERQAWTATYDGLGRRISAGRGDSRAHYWWDGDRLAAETSASGRLRIYVYAHPRALVPIGFTDYDSVDAPSSSGRGHSVFSDQAGLPLHIEDDHGQVVWWADHVDPYGAITARGTIDYALRWPGHYYDADTGLHYNRFRYYDPWLGRYLESDPIGCAGGTNVYAYPSNPLVSIDVLGLHNEHTHPSEETTPGHPDQEGAPTVPRRNASGALIDERGRFVADPDATGDSIPDFYATRERIVGFQAALDADDPHVRAALD